MRLVSRWYLILVSLTCLPCTTVTADTSDNYILNLYDAFGPERDGLVQDFGFSALVRYGDTTILLSHSRWAYA